MERQIQAQAQAQASGLNDTSKVVRDPGSRRSKLKPDTKALMEQLLELKSGMTKLEGQADDLVLGGVRVDDDRRTAREAQGGGLLEKLEMKHGGDTAQQSDRSAALSQPRQSTEFERGGGEAVAELDRRLDELEKKVGTGSSAGVDVSRQFDSRFSISDLNVLSFFSRDPTQSCHPSID